jgi:uncharacterized protein with WD repeat
MQRLANSYLHGFAQRNLKSGGWPYLHWTHDEKHPFVQVTNEIRVYEGNVFTENNGEVRFVDKMRCPGLTSMSVLKDGNHVVLSLDHLCAQSKGPTGTTIHAQVSEQRNTAQCH